MKKYWVYAAIGLAIVLSFVLSDSFRQVIARRRSIKATNEELRQVDAQTAEAKDRLSRLQNDPSAYEQLVRQELGYLRPGEKEVRFLKNNSR
jgi:cell division protein FtsB